MLPLPNKPPFADGVYFGLPEAIYHEDRALGSSDLKYLFNSGASYWFQRLFPERPDEVETRSRLLGKAVHRIVLEGLESFDAGYIVEPVMALRTIEELRAWIAAAGHKAKGTLKADIIAQVQSYAANVAEPPVIFEVFRDQAAAAGRVILKEEECNRITFASAQIASNPELVNAFCGGYPEVSIFWTETVNGQPVRRKARIDYLKPRATVDLKSIRPRGERSFDIECGQAFSRYRYDIQAAAYMQARERFPELVKRGAVYGEVAANWLSEVAAQPAGRTAFVIVFWATAGAPMTWAVKLSPNNPILEVGRTGVQRGLETFAAFTQSHGDREPWVIPSPLSELSIDDLPRWFGR